MRKRWVWQLLMCPVLCLLLASCAAIPRKMQAVILYGGVTPGAAWTVGAIEVEHLTGAEKIRRMTEEALGLVAAENGVTVARPGEAAPVVLELWISEREITRDLRTLNTIVVTATLRDAASSTLLLRAVYSAETQDTLLSFYHLYGVLDALCAAATDRIRKAGGTE